MRTMIVMASAWLILVTGQSTASAQDRKRPVLAVFPINNRGTTLTGEEVEALTDYLSTRLGEGGHYRVIPRNEIRKRLFEQKTESYKECYDKSCQIEIGRELAAELTVSAGISKLGEKCIITAGLYHLGKAATLRTGTAKGACEPERLLVCLDEVVAKLLPEGAAEKPREQPRPTPVTPPPGEKSTQSVVYVDIHSVPAGADVNIGERYMGVTPLRLGVEIGKPYEVELHKDGFQDIKSQFTPTKPDRLNFELSRDKEQIRQAEMGRTEWIVLEPKLGLHDTSLGYGAVYRFFTLKWQYVYWTILEVEMTISKEYGTSVTPDGFLGMQLGYPLYLGEEGRHQLRFGLLMGYCFMEDEVDDTNPGGFCLGPAVSYIYQTGGWFHVGASLRLAAPVATQKSTRDFPIIFSFTVPLGWTGSAD